MTMKSWNNKDAFKALLTPIPDDPSKYRLDIVIRNRDAATQIPEQTRKEINKVLASPHTRDMRISGAFKTTSGWRQVKGLQMREALDRRGLSWLTIPNNNGGCNLVLEYLEKSRKAELPFVPEFAHDLQRARKMVDGSFYDVMPITAEFVPTLNCPFRCQQCAYKIHKLSAGLWSVNDASDSRWQMKLDIVKPLVLRLADAGVRYMVVTGGGEPLMNYKATLLALHAAKEFGLRTGLYTNGSLLTKQIVNHLLEEKPQFVRVSVNAATEKTHAVYHRPISGKDTFHNVQEGVEHLALAKLVTGQETEIGLSYIVNEENYAEIGQFAQWVKNIVERSSSLAKEKGPGINFVRFTPTIDYFAHVQLSQEFCDQALERITTEAKPILEDLGVSTVVFARFSETQKGKSYEECLGCSWYAEVSPDGSLYTCCEMNFLPGYRIGNLLTDSIATVWESEERKRLIEKVNKGCLRACPVFCKPHSVNKIAYAIKNACKNERNKAMVWKWLQDLNTLHTYVDDAFFCHQRTVAF